MITARIPRHAGRIGVERDMGKFRSVVLLSFILIAVSSATAQSPLFPQRGAGGGTREAAEQLFALTNQARAKHGAAPLQWDGDLAEAARQHCLRMAAEGPIAHRYAGEADLSERAGQAGAHFSLIEENVAVGPSPAEIHDAWMHSPGHRSNLLNPAVDRVGIAIVAARGNLYAVADYERGVQELDRAQVESRVAALVAPSGVNIVRNNGAAREACRLDSGMPSRDAAGMPHFIMRWQDSDLSRLPQALREKLASGQYRSAEIGSCTAQKMGGDFTTYRVAVLLF